MKKQLETRTKQTQENEPEPWETRLSLGSYLKHLSNGGAEHVDNTEKTRLDSSQGKPNG